MTLTSDLQRRHPHSGVGEAMAGGTQEFEVVLCRPPLSKVEGDLVVNVEQASDLNPGLGRLGRGVEVTLIAEQLLQCGSTSVERLGQCLDAKKTPFLYLDGRTLKLTGLQIHLEVVEKDLTRRAGRLSAKLG
ncbi:hypothetical protein OF850_12740 [Roseococcus sp. MDT2-1-1]|uniref:Uncharacterized protein n=1 Tax=Sabulicella glaciei TaxID=2984948 RepID=A0ABT3NWG7_9PROT|nr:hypothetical protein [Roseococcus sp. MDT2-1-1]MCW8086500.1 hypothetical protein [Roseococcus sp. MDT2-1-1]